MKEAAALKKLGDILKAAGIDAPIPTASDLLNARDSGGTGISTSLEAEATLAFVRKPEDFKTKRCINCNELFAVNRQAVGYCTDRCRAVALQKIGIQWDPRRKPEERWGFWEQPLVVPVVVLRRIHEQLQELDEATLLEVPHEEEESSHQTTALAQNFQSAADEFEKEFGDVHF